MKFSRLPLPLFLLPFFFFSCKPVATEEQTLQFESCKKELLDTKEAFIALGPTTEKRDSLRQYISDLESNNLDDLISKLEVEPEHINLLIYSICEKAARMNQDSGVEDVISKADSLFQFIDSIEKQGK